MSRHALAPVSHALLTAALAVSAALSYAAAPDRLAEELAEAARLAKMGDYAAAADASAPLLDRAWAERGPADADVVRAVGARAGWARLAGRPGEVLKALRRLESVSPPTTASLLERARILRLDGDAAAAASLAEEAAAFGDEPSYLELALCREAQGRVDPAIAALRRGLAAHPGSSSLRVKLAELLRRTGGFEEAMKLYAQARALDPARSDVYFQEGYARLFAGQQQESARVFQDWVSVSSGSADARQHAAVALWHRGDLEGGLEAMEKTVALYESERLAGDEYAHALLSLISMRESMGRDGLENLARKAVAATSPDSHNNYNARVFLAILRAERGDARGAMSELSAAEEQYRKSGGPQYMQAMTETARKQINLSAEITTLAAKSASASNTTRREEHLKLLSLKTAQRKHLAARARSDASVGQCQHWDCAPVIEAGIWMRRAISEHAAGYDEEARRAADRAVLMALMRTKVPDAPEFDARRIRILIRCAGTYRDLGDEAAARAAFAAAAPFAAAIPEHSAAANYRRMVEKIEGR